MSDELKAAAERWSQYKGLSWPEIFDNRGCIDDAVFLIQSYLADLAAREAEERERAAKPTKEWFLSRGYEPVPTDDWEHDAYRYVRNGAEIILVCVDSAWIAIRGCGVDPDYRDDITRGHVMDAEKVAGLKIPMKGGGV